ncbi:hypothetical protein MUK42_20260 [Musa troglodytarum]|uniref:Uncharacterized protein n=1 Tax=Musa troglodytarum TaxID=320322 RepID=A0A9E7FV46_9LILI|nr:hypothetical protein MUK42_20260 [Musa troglodytarum]
MRVNWNLKSVVEEDIGEPNVGRHDHHHRHLRFACTCDADTDTGGASIVTPSLRRRPSIEKSNAERSPAVPSLPPKSQRLLSGSPAVIEEVCSRAVAGIPAELPPTSCRHLSPADLNPVTPPTMSGPSSPWRRMVTVEHLGISKLLLPRRRCALERPAAARRNLGRPIFCPVVLTSSCTCFLYSPKVKSL